MPTVTIISRSPAATEQLGYELGLVVAKGAIIGLHGDLGAGKTQWVRGLARGLGGPGRVHSPTFTLVNEYGGGRLPLWHWDLFRLERANMADEALEASAEEHRREESVTVIEWAERLGERWRREANWQTVRIEIVDETTRKFTYDDPRA